MRSKVVQRILDKMDAQPWHVKLKRNLRIRLWIWLCLTRKYWDKDFEGYLFK